MSRSTECASHAELQPLLTEFVQQAEKVVALQLRLARREIGTEIAKARGAATWLGGGAVLLALAGLYGSQAAVHLVRRWTRLPLWSCYAVAAGAAAGAGWTLVDAGRRQAAAIKPGLPQTRAALGENLSWVKEQMK